MNKEELRELVYINLGRASMCWSEIPKGVFDSTKAAKLGKEIMEAIDEYVEEEDIAEINAMFAEIEEQIRVSEDNQILEETDWMEEHREDYNKVLKSGMFWEWHPEWTGEWEQDKYAFCHERLFLKK